MVWEALREVREGGRRGVVGLEGMLVVDGLRPCCTGVAMLSLCIQLLHVDSYRSATRRGIQLCTRYGKNIGRVNPATPAKLGGRSGFATALEPHRHLENPTLSRNERLYVVAAS